MSFIQHCLIETSRLVLVSRPIAAAAAYPLRVIIVVFSWNGNLLSSVTPRYFMVVEHLMCLSPHFNSVTFILFWFLVINTYFRGVLCDVNHWLALWSWSLIDWCAISAVVADTNHKTSSAYPTRIKLLFKFSSLVLLRRALLYRRYKGL